ncbi:MAG TPA: DUF1501 domain-containing protein [Blastocatellia bacterium]|nr:DUF1501 domain-containing protein [Blastocatellia bacterium]
MKQTRRAFLRQSCGALSAAAMAAGIRRFGLINALAQRAAPTDYKALVCIFLNGGNDCNNTVVPLDTSGYQAYSSVRSSSGLAIPQGSLLPITPPSIGTQFGLHPGLADLHSLWSQQKLAIACNVGPLIHPMTREQYRTNSVPKPYQLFSHSDQVTQWQSSISNTRSQTGWGGRLSDLTAGFNGGNAFPMTTSVAGSNIFSIGMNARPLVIAPAPTGLNQVLALNGFGSSAEEQARRNSMNHLRTIDRSNALVAATSDTTQQALDISMAFSTDPTLATVFPATTLGNQLKQVAKVMKLNQTSAQLSLERQIFFCSLGGFDTHQNQPASQEGLLTQVSQAMKAFYDATVELGIASQVTTFTLSDFGRTLQPSGSGASVGTDHGWGNHLFVMGGAVRGGDFYGVAGPNGTVFPTLQLGGSNDTDSRGRWIPTASVEQYAATLASWYGLAQSDLSQVFPLIGNFTSSSLGFMM